MVKVRQFYVCSYLISSCVDNQLVKLPKGLGNLEKLKKVYLQNNQLEKLQSALGRCIKLETINVENNKLTGVAKRIGNLPNLRHLLLAGNLLKSLPFNPLETAPGLRRLTLSGNQLSNDLMKLEKVQDVRMGEITEGGDDDF